MEIVRVGFIGCGGQATGNIYPHVASIPEMELVACCDLKPELAQRNAERFGAKAWYTDYEKMLSEEELDAVFVVGPPQMHTELAIACLEKGYHVLGDGKEMSKKRTLSFF